MSILLINQYYNNLDRTIQFGKSTNEQSIRNHFWSLLNDYARKYNYEVVPEVYIMGTKGKKVYPDGIVKNLWGLDIGLWESKDEKDDIDAEIDAKIKKGYPLTNILFEDSKIAILFQRGEEVGKAKVREPEKLDQILTAFFSFKSDTVYKFEDAIIKFKVDIPVIVETLRGKIIETRETNKEFLEAQRIFFELCKVEINPNITLEDIREMMIQHILTSDIFSKIFDDPEFHHHNTIAAELEKLIGILFTYAERKNLLNEIEHYYEAINATAAGITDHHEKQKFLKVLYENFYKVYNPKAADRLGVVYTPNEIVQFMVKSTDYLLHRHFGKTLADKNVEILDPATGTGTFICEIIENAIPTQNLDYKFKNEIHANEVAILPYYIANLNIEFTFKQKMRYYAEFPNICFVDTLDNTNPLSWGRMGIDQGIQTELFGLTSENTERIKRQNNKKISVVIGNPPYNANQLNENENNKNREYPFIDKRIKDTFIKYSTAQKTKVYDMYARFYRWAMDRLDKNGILAFITNRSFIDSRTFDGFRKCVQDDFTHCYIVDTKSDVRANPKIAGTTHNVFGIQTGVAIMFLIKKEKHEERCHIEYIAMEDIWRKEVKLNWLKNHPLENIHFETIHPDNNYNWINLPDTDFETLLPLYSKIKSEKVVFKESSNGISSNRDEWVYDFHENNLRNKVSYFIDNYNKSIDDSSFNESIKWSRDLKNKFYRKNKLSIELIEIVPTNYRPFFKQKLALNNILVDVISSNRNFFSNKNTAICINGSSKDFRFLCVNTYPDLHFTGDTKCLPLYTFDESGNAINNVTDWGLKEFIKNYQEDNIKKEDIFHYTYAFLHNPTYRSKYELNLKREFPRLPFYKDFWKWAAWGKTLMDLHINYETIEPFELKRIDKIEETKKAKQSSFIHDEDEPQSMFARKLKLKVMLKANKIDCTIYIDERTSLHDIPKEAWKYKLGNRSALEWVLDQYKEKKPSDPTIAEKFNTYLFADYKEHVIDLLKKVCTVSVKTMEIIKEMEIENQ